MPTGLENLAQLGGQVVVVCLFIWYLIQKDKQVNIKDEQINKTLEAFNITIQNHLAHALTVEVQMTKALSSLTNCITAMSGKQDNRNRTIDRRYEAEKKT